MADGEALRELFVSVGINVEGLKDLDALNQAIDDVAKSAQDTSGLKELDKTVKETTKSFQFSQDTLAKFQKVLESYSSGDIQQATGLLADFGKEIKTLSATSAAATQIERLQEAMKGGNLREASDAYSRLNGALRELSTDGERSKDALEAVGKVLDSLMRGDVKASIEGFKNLQTEFKGLVAGVKAFAVVQLGREMTGSLERMAADAGNTAARIKEQATALRTTTQEIQTAEIVVKRFGGNADNVAQIMENFIGMANRAMTGSGGDIGLLRVLGGKPGQDPVDMLATFADHLQKLPVHLRDMAASQAGLKDMMPLLRMGGDYIREQGTMARRTAAIWTDETVTAGVELKRAMASINAEFGIMDQAMQAKLMPFMRDVAIAIKGLVQDLSMAVQDFDLRSQKAQEIIEELLALVKTLAVAWGLYTLALNANRIGTIAWAAISQGIPAILTAITTGMKALTAATLLAAAPPAALAAAIALVGTAALLVIDDLKTFSEGGKSYLGDLFGAADGYLRPVTDMFGDMQESIGSILEWIKELPDVFVKSVQELEKSVPALEGVSKAFGAVAEAVGLVDEKTSPEEDQLAQYVDKISKMREKLEEMKAGGDTKGAESMQKQIDAATGKRDDLLAKVLKTMPAEDASEMLSRIGDANLRDTALRMAAEGNTYNGTVNVGQIQTNVSSPNPAQAGASVNASVNQNMQDNARRAAALARGRSG